MLSLDADLGSLDRIGSGEVMIFLFMLKVPMVVQRVLGNIQYGYCTVLYAIGNIPVIPEPNSD